MALSIPSPSKVASDIEKRYHLNTQNIQSQGELFNVAQNKQPAPEVSISFSPSDPRPGEKLTAKAFPIFFTNREEDLYYGWYLKRAGCDLTNSPSAAKKALCDRDKDGNITVEDWKTEASALIAQNGFDNSATSYASDSDSDGYKARFGGDSKQDTPDYCYIHDNASGQNYELVNRASDTSFTCPAGTTPACVVEELEDDVVTGVQTASGVCTVSGIPVCSSSTPSCSTGTPKCVADFYAPTCSEASLSSCSTISSGSASPSCKHLFPDAPGQTSGDGVFGANEENFWSTDPNDPDTSDNGNKDEANVVGLGRSSFTWNYTTGDQVGVAVEGTSMIATKHDNSSTMIMWAFPRQNCPVSLASGTGAYTETVKGYVVTIPTADMDLNDCIEGNLVDPSFGGQAKNLEVAVTATPNEAINDETSDKGGDLVVAQASVSNGGTDLTNTLFDWKVEMSDNIQFSSSIGAIGDVTADLQGLDLLGSTKGNALDSIRVKMDIPRSTSLSGRPLSAYLNNGIGYMRLSSKVSENFSGTITRKGKSDVIIKFVSTGRKIIAYKPDPILAGSAMHVTLSNGSSVICNVDPLDRNTCRVIKNEIIGLGVDDTGLANFNWTINGAPLKCSLKGVSPDCSDTEQGPINFFPVTGNVGDSYTVTLNATDVATGNMVTLSRTFNVIEPEVTIVSPDQNMVWPKFLGQYKDITGTAASCPSGLCNDYSENIFQTFSGNIATLQANFIPSFLGTNSQRFWNVDGVITNETAPMQVSFQANKLEDEIYNVSLGVSVVQSDQMRRALFDIWNVSPLDSPEISFSRLIQVEVESGTIATGPFAGPKKYLAALVSYIPQSILFAFRIFLSGALVLFATGFLFALMPEQVPARASPGRRPE